MISIVKGDITKEETDVIVCAANQYLVLGSGLAGAVNRAGGPTIQEECNLFVAKNGSVPPGSFATTSAGDMPSTHVIHAVGP